MANDNFSAACYYKAHIDTCPVQGWTKVDGLSINVETEPKEEGGNPLWKRILVKGIKYGPISLTRPVGPDSNLLVAWFTSTASKLIPGGAFIELHHADGSLMHTWTLMHVVPSSYKVSALGAGQAEIVTETVTFEHQGMLEGIMGALAGSVIGI